MNRDLLRQGAVVVAFLATILVNTLANALPLNGITTGEISARFPVLFTPAAYAFSIWGFIYLLLAAFSVYQALPAQRENPRLRAVGWWFALSCVFNIAWVFLWHYGYFALNQVAMVGLLASLMLVYSRLDIALLATRGGERWWVEVPFSVYLGWISVATIANGAVVLRDAGWNGGSLGPIPWTLLMLAVGAGLGLGMAVARRDAAFPLVLVWAYGGIFMARREDVPPLAVAAAGLAVVLLAAAIWTAWQRRQPAPIALD